MSAPPWLTVARSYEGLKELPGPRHNEKIRLWLAKLGAWWQDDETPWCGTFVAHCLQEAKLPIPEAWYRARAWMSYGDTTVPTVGAILVFTRPGGGGHVGFYVAEDKTHYHVLGGNQANSVNVSRLAKARCIGVRWPRGVAVRVARPRASTRAPTSQNEE